MFNGNFKESTSAIVPIDMDSSILQRIIHYCYTDETKIGSLDDCTDEEVRELVNLQHAANYFQLNGFDDEISRNVYDTIVKYPSLACSVLDECFRLGGKNYQCGLSEVALAIMERLPRQTLLPKNSQVHNQGGILALSSSVLIRIMQSGNLAMDDYNKFLALQVWCGEEAIANGGPKAELPEEDRLHRVAVAKELALNDVDLLKIRPRHLSTITGSELLKQCQLYEAFKAHAIAMEDEYMPGRVFFRSDTRQPFLVVTGAGIPEANGRYYLCHEIYGFSKRAVWNGQNGEFVISRHRRFGTPGDGLWTMSWPNKNGKRLYFDNGNQSQTKTIPGTSWMLDDKNGASPAPHIVHVNAESQTNESAPMATTIYRAF